MANNLKIVMQRNIQHSLHRKCHKTIAVYLVRCIFLYSIFFVFFYIISPNIYLFDHDSQSDDDNLRIIVITPTYPRNSRIADMTRLAQTLSHVHRNLHWYVIEDGNFTSDAISRLLKRSRIKHTYISVARDWDYPGGGWTQRNAALNLLRSKHDVNDKNHTSIVYFADDDNSYDIRLFSEYLPKIKTVGVWAVGLVGGVKVESPRVRNNTVVGWDVSYIPSRKFAIDMAGFAVNLHLILVHSHAHFNKDCKPLVPEDCFLQMLNLSLDELQAFGHDRIPRDLFVWHTQTRRELLNGDSHGYVFES